MRVVTVLAVDCWGCDETTTCLRFIGRSGHRRMDICMWCLAASMELVTGFGVVRAMRQWASARNVSVELKGPDRRKFALKGTRRFRHQ